MKIPSIAYSILLVLLALVWVTYCHDPSVRKDTLQEQQDTKDDSVRANHDRWKADFMRRDSARDDSLKRLRTYVVRTRSEIARLKAQIPGAQPDTTGGSRESPLPAGTQSPSGCAGTPAVCDSVIAEQDTTIAQLDSTVTLWQAMSADRDTRIEQLEGENTAYRTSRDAWKHITHPGIVAKLSRAVPYIAAGIAIGAALK